VNVVAVAHDVDAVDAVDAVVHISGVDVAAGF